LIVARDWRQGRRSFQAWFQARLRHPAARRAAAAQDGHVRAGTGLSRRGVVVAAVAGVLGAGGVGLAAVRSSQPGWRGPLRIVTGGTKGVYYAYGLAFADEIRRVMPGVRPEVVPTTGSIENLRLLAARQADVAFVAADAAAEALAGRAPFPAPVAVAAIARAYDDYLHLVVPLESDVDGLRRLTGRRVSLGPVGSGTALMAERLLDAAGLPARVLRVRRLGINESVAALRAGELDAFFWSGGLPTSGVAELAGGRPIRLVPLGRHAPPLRQRYGAVYRTASVPAGVYRLRERVATIAVPNVLACSADADRAGVRALTRALFAGRDVLARRVPQAEALDERSAIATFPLPLHPGAQDHYRAVKP
jgi:TRAP transporter TAXI family solute receptor